MNSMIGFLLPLVMLFSISKACSQSNKNKVASAVKKGMVEKSGVRKLDKHSLLQGVWTQNIDSSASFVVKKNRIYYFDGAESKSVAIEIIGDKIITYFSVNIVIKDTVLKLTSDSLVFRDEEGKVSRFVKVK